MSIHTTWKTPQPNAENQKIIKKKTKRKKTQLFYWKRKKKTFE